jgi:hypothetical protein
MTILVVGLLYRKSKNIIYKMTIQAVGLLHRKKNIIYMMTILAVGLLHRKKTKTLLVTVEKRKHSIN